MQPMLLPHSAASPYPEVGKTFSIITARVRPGAPVVPLVRVAAPLSAASLMSPVLSLPASELCAS